MYIGVNYLENGYKDDELKHRNIFPSFRRDTLPSYKNFTKNSYPELRHYSRQIIEQIKSNSHATHIIVSDEAIGDYYNHEAESNIAKIVIIGNLVRSTLGETNITCHMSFCIRRQDHWLWSFFHHHSHLNGRFSNFIDKKVLNHGDDVFGLNYMQCLQVYRLLAGKSWEIRAVPFELLAVDHNALSYLKKAFFLEEDQLMRVDNIVENSKQLKQTISAITQKKANRYTPLGRAGFRLSTFSNSNNNSPAYYLLKLASSLLLKADYLLAPILPATYFNPDPPLSDSQKILSFFSDDNRMLSEELGEYALQRYGYITE